MEYPSAIDDKIKYWFWWIYTPFHPHMRDLATFLGIVKHEKRQDFLLGTLDSSRSVRDFISFLISQGWGNHFVAWKDSGELVSLRRTVGFHYQYHLRVFQDGEIRCHYEYTPEYRPIQHLIETGFEKRSAEFLSLLRDWIVPARELANASS